MLSEAWRVHGEFGKLAPWHADKRLENQCNGTACPECDCCGHCAKDCGCQGCTDTECLCSTAQVKYRVNVEMKLQ